MEESINIKIKPTVISGIIILMIRLQAVIVGAIPMNELLSVCLPGIFFAVMLFFGKKNIFLLVSAIINYLVVMTSEDLVFIFSANPGQGVAGIMMICFFIFSYFLTDSDFYQIIKKIFWLPAIIYFLATFFTALSVGWLFGCMLCGTEALTYLLIAKWVVGGNSKKEEILSEELCRKLQADVVDFEKVEFDQAEFDHIMAKAKDTEVYNAEMKDEQVPIIHEKTEIKKAVEGISYLSENSYTLVSDTSELSVIFFSETDYIVDEIRKFKRLCDICIISQEEFETKKKQLLGL